MKMVQSGDIVSFGDWVQQRRQALDLTRPALARQISCSPSTIKKIERDERRPSRQIAALLADQLLIPASDQDRFLAMARGEFVATPLGAPNLISMPPFLRPSADRGDRAFTPLVARQRELAQLDAHLTAALAGNGSIAFITGEAGDGKTLLAQAFVRRSQEKYPDLVVATGNCNAYTGIGDPYLPFREILELLTGDIEARWGAGAMSLTHARRLWRLAPQTVQALVEAGPDLVDTFVAGTPLLNRTTATVTHQDRTLLDRLEALIIRHQEERPATHMHQGNLFAQYARLLQSLARRQPLLLIIDDLQWVDAGSTSLLFHLSRHLQGQRILLVGIYRAAEVALGHGGERHPLVPLVNEMQRTFGEIHVRLNQADGRGFVDALIDNEHNQLDQSFRAALYRQTAGHALFTVELMHGLQTRGDIVRTADGEWVESPDLNWQLLPARVEGIIKERIGRLAQPLQELLQIASVAGETFDAALVARVQDVDERLTAGRLGTTLDREQRSVTMLGSQQVGAQQLVQYRFRHILFQQYLYNSLDPSQRIYLHNAVARELEQRYGDEAKRIAPQLARHYAIACDNPRAMHYFGVAGDMAAAIYANTEAVVLYRSALELASLAPDNAALQVSHPQRLQLYTRLGRSLELSAQHAAAIAVYEEMERVAQAAGDQAMVLASLLARTAIRTTVNFARDPVKGQALLEQAQLLARDLDDGAAEAKILWNLLVLNAYTGGDPDQRLAYGEQALTLARELELPEQLAYTLHDIFYAYAGIGQWQNACQALSEARDLWRQLDNLPMLSEALMRLHWTYLVAGEYEQAMVHAEEAYRLGVESHNLDAQALSHFMIGFVHWERGRIDQALAVMEEDIAIAESVSSLTPLIGTRADLGLLYGELGDFEHGLALADLARTVAEEQLPILRFWPHAIQVSLQLRQGNMAAAEELIATLSDYRTVKERFGYMPFMWVRVGLAHGEFALQMQAYDQATALMDSLYTDLCKAGIWYLRADVLYLKGRALIGQGPCNAEETCFVLEQARAAATKLGSCRALWPIMVSLGEDATCTGDVTTAAIQQQEARTVVDEIARHIPTISLRDAFLGLPKVKALLSA